MTWSPPLPPPFAAAVEPHVVFGYRSDLMRRVTQMNLAVFGVAGPLVLVSAVVGGPPLVFAVLFNAVVVWNAYWFAWRIGWMIEVDGDNVKWCTLVRTRTLSVHDLSGNRTYSGWQRIDARVGCSPILMTADRGWPQFLERLNGVHPQRPFRPTRLSRFGERWPGSRPFYGYYERTEFPTKLRRPD